MKQYIDFALDNGDVVRVEINEKEVHGVVKASRSKLPEKAQETFEQALTKLIPVTNTVIQKLRTVGEKPDELEVAFGFNLSAKAVIILSSASTSANFSVTLRWSNNQSSSSKK